MTTENSIPTHLVDAEGNPNPEEGQHVMFCPHISERTPQWYHCENTEFVLGDIAKPVHWMAVCSECELVLEADPKAQVLTGLGVYEKYPERQVVPLMLKPVETA